MWIGFSVRLPCLSPHDLPETAGPAQLAISPLPQHADPARHCQLSCSALNVKSSQIDEKADDGDFGWESLKFSGEHWMQCRTTVCIIPQQLYYILQTIRYTVFVNDIFLSNNRDFLG